jgi:DNA-binding NarL/FixJ family response regulator
MIPRLFEIKILGDNLMKAFIVYDEETFGELCGVNSIENVSDDLIEHLLNDFTSKQKKIIEELDKGLSNKEIAYDLGITENTVKGYVRRLTKSLECHNRTELLHKIREIGKHTKNSF